MGYSPLGQRIRRGREALGMSRRQLAKDADIPYSTLSNIETSLTPVRTNEEHLKRISQVLDIPFDQLRILAGYLLAPSSDHGERRKRLLAMIEAKPRLERALKAILSRGDAHEIDTAIAYIEFLLERKKPAD